MDTDPASVEVALIMLVVSSWLNVAMYTLELALCVRYFSRPSRPFLHKLAVGLLVFMDGFCTLSISFSVCLAAVPTNFTTNLRLLFLPIATEILATNVSAGITQLFLCNLFHNLRQIACSWVSAIALLVTLQLDEFVVKTTSIGAILCAATDVLIAASLAWKFSSMMADTIPEHSRRSLLRQVLILTVSSGAICASNTLLMMTFILKSHPVFYLFFNCQGRVYALTILGNFLVGIPAWNQTQTTPSRFSNFTAVVHIPDSIARVPRNANISGSEMDGPLPAPAAIESKARIIH
ncbi:hypothetical protein MVEN_01423100 [Mycena venus]|uniref:DUF6534 domain-containing protein n=1 Tax=Mycena venus TaxID=2733690 RepID=A0A8H6XYC7_9AGAR|nr:hypothetical protein MVEN_01423100 [Mycena venus]